MTSIPKENQAVQANTLESLTQASKVSLSEKPGMKVHTAASVSQPKDTDSAFDKFLPLVNLILIFIHFYFITAIAEKKDWGGSNQ